MSIRTSEQALKPRIKQKLDDSFMRKAISGAQDLINKKREDRFAELGNYEKWRDLAADIREHVIENLDYYLDQFSTNAEKAGATVYFAKDAAEANDIAKKIFKTKNAKKR